MARTDRAEVAAVQRDDRLGAEALGEGDHRSIGPAEGEIGVLLDQFGHADQVRWRRCDDIVTGQPTQETRFDERTGTPPEEVQNLSQHQGRNHDVKVGALQNS